MIISNNVKIAFIFSLILFIPSFLQISLSSSSMALGLLFSIFFIFLLLRNKLIIITSVNMFILIIFTLHFLITMIIFSDYLQVKNLISFLMLILCLYVANIFSLNLMRIDNKKLFNFLRSICLLLLFLGIISLFYNFQFLGYDKYPKSVFPFSEPGHFALNIGAIFLFVGIYSNVYIRLILFFSIFLISIFLPSVLLLLISLVMLFFYFLISIKRFIFFMVIFFIFIFISLDNYQNFSYFADRLNFSSETKNLTALVYLQGWEDMLISLKETYGFGLGFQNMGIQPFGEYAEIIHSIAGIYKNRMEGACLANKIVSELGVLGLLLIVLYLYKLVNSIKFIISFIKKYHKKQKLLLENKYKSINIFSHTIIIMFFIELFARGNGYFSTGVFLLLVAIFITDLNNKNVKENLI